MSNLRDVFAGLSLVLGFYAVVPYLISIVKRQTIPHQLSWLIFTIMNGVIFLSQYLAGGRASVLVFFAAYINNLAILALSFKYGVRTTSRWDRILFVAALFLIVVWIVTKSNGLAIWLTLLIDLAATLMLLLKIRSNPKSENLQAWSVITVACFFSLLTLFGKSHSYILYIRPIWGILTDGLCAVAIIYYRKQPATIKP